MQLKLKISLSLIKLILSKILALLPSSSSLSLCHLCEESHQSPSNTLFLSFSITINKNSRNCPQFDLLSELGKLSVLLSIYFSQGYTINQLQKTVMGNSHFTFPSDLAEEWIQINSNGKLLIRNTISQQIFSMHHFSKNSSTDTKEYLRRSIYSLPHTPRIIVLEENADSFYILAQQSLTQLKFLLRKKNLLIQVLQIIKDLILVGQQLKQKYGAFEIKQDLIGVLKNEQIFMWINSKFELIQIQSPITHKNEEQIMIASIVNICQKHCKFNLSFLFATQAATLTFSHFINQLALKMEIQKLKLTQKHIISPQLFKNEKERLKRDNSSKNVHSNLKNFDRKCNCEPNGFSNHRKHPTLVQETRNIGLASPIKKKVNRRVTSQEIFSPITEKTEEESLNSINQQKLQFSQASIPIINLKQMKIFKDSKVSGSRASPTPTNQEITFHEEKVHKQNNWNLKKRITCSTQENIDNFSDSYRRQSTIRWVQEPLASEKSIIEDYHCLFAKSAINISLKTNYEEGYKFNI